MAQLAKKVVVRVEGFLQFFVRLEGFFVILFQWQREVEGKLNNKGAKTRRF
jgi:hypothetical protein